MAGKILIADDDISFTEILSRRLESAGYATQSVYEGIRVMEACRKERPDLIILDLKIPAGAGIEVLERLKKDTETRRIPVVVMTGTYPWMEKESLEKGASAFFLKPYDPDLLLAKINVLLKP